MTVALGWSCIVGPSGFYLKENLARILAKTFWQKHSSDDFSRYI